MPKQLSDYGRQADEAQLIAELIVHLDAVRDLLRVRGQQPLGQVEKHHHAGAHEPVLYEGEGTGSCACAGAIRQADP